MANYKVHLTDEEVKLDTVPHNDFRADEQLRVKAKALPANSITPTGVTYPNNIKEVENGRYSMDHIMKSIVSIDRTACGYSGYTIDRRDNSVKKFDVYLHQTNSGNKEATIKGLLGHKSCTIKPRGNEHRNRFKLSSLNRYNNISTLIACIELLLRGFYLVDWNTVCANHKDNTAGVKIAVSNIVEFIHPINLELYLKRKPSLNNFHGIIWKEIYDIGIHSSYSLYNMEFLLFVYALIQADKLNENNLMSWRNKRVDKDTGMVYFD